MGPLRTSFFAESCPVLIFPSFPQGVFRVKQRSFATLMIKSIVLWLIPSLLNHFFFSKRWANDWQFLERAKAVSVHKAEKYLLSLPLSLHLFLPDLELLQNLGVISKIIHYCNIMYHYLNEMRNIISIIQQFHSQQSTSLLSFGCSPITVKSNNSQDEAPPYSCNWCGSLL